MSDILPQDIRVGEYEGFRAFDIVGNGLSSYNASYVWKPGENEALCFSVGGYRDKSMKALRNRPDGNGVEIIDVLPSHGRIPDPSCKCGFWVYLSPGKLLKNGGSALLGARRRRGSSARPVGAKNGFGDFGHVMVAEGKVAAQVKGWGRVIEGDDGFRCEKAAITSLIALGNVAEIARLADIYQVPMVQPEGFQLQQNDGSYLGVVWDIGPQLPVAPSGHRPPRSVIIDGLEFKVWESGYAWRTIEKAGVGSTFAIEYEKDTFRGEDQLMIQSVVEVDPVKAGLISPEDIELLDS